MVQVVEHLSSKNKGLSSNPNTSKKNQGLPGLHRETQSQNKTQPLFQHTDVTSPHLTDSSKNE
jgi:hypothetical protein